MRAQTTLDFATGIAVFLIALLFVLQFTPGTLQPFTAGTQEETVASDRVADQLAGGMLGDPGEPYLLDEDCTVAFFDDTSPAECAFDGATLKERLGLGALQRVNVTARGNVTTGNGQNALLCWDADNDRLWEQAEAACGDSGGDVPFRIGDQPPERRAGSVSARRVVSFDGRDVTLVVVMW